ncbi:replicative DNA helicase [Nostoc sp.]|uniref:replicative DNA helicase n=1 Tax=Nostoc sp. TaxID=1180 RepID=UPI002FF4D9FE
MTMLSSGNEIVKLGYDQSQSIVERLDEAEQKIFAIRHQSQLDNEPRLIGEISATTFEEIERLSTGEQQDNIPTGFYDLDTMLGGGFQGGQLAVVAARPSMGKSALGHQFAYTISLAHEAPTMVFSLEMSAKEINRRFIAYESRIPTNYLKSGKLSPTQWVPLSEEIARVHEAKMVIDDTASQTLVKIRSKVRTVIMKHGSLKLVVIDYLQLMVDEGERQLAQRVGELTRGLKLLARECDVPIILLSQLNRGPETRTNKRPMLSDLRDSGRIEEDADLVLGLYRDEYYNPDSPDRGVAEVIILKNRNGQTGTVKLLFYAQFTWFKNLARF